MKKYLTSEIMNELLESINRKTFKNDDLYKIRQLIMAKILKEIENKEFDRYGEVLKLDINRDIILNNYNVALSKNIINVIQNILNIPMIVTKYEDSILISDLHEVSIVYKYLIEYGYLNNLQISHGTVLYLKDNNIKVLNYKQDVKFENILKNTKYIFENEATSSLRDALMNYIKQNLCLILKDDNISLSIRKYNGPTYDFKDKLSCLDEVMNIVACEMIESNIELDEYIQRKKKDFEHNISLNIANSLLDLATEQKLDVNALANKIFIKDITTIKWINDYIARNIQHKYIRDVIKFNREQEFILTHKNKLNLFVRVFEFNKEIDKIIEQIDNSVEKDIKTLLFSGSILSGPYKVERCFFNYEIPVKKGNVEFYLNGIKAGRKAILDFREMKEFTLSYRGKVVFHFTENMVKRISEQLDKILGMKIK